MRNKAASLMSKLPKKGAPEKWAAAEGEKRALSAFCPLPDQAFLGDARHKLSIASVEKAAR
jgi:hypothetical protein